MEENSWCLVDGNDKTMKTVYMNNDAAVNVVLDKFESCNIGV